MLPQIEQGFRLIDGTLINQITETVNGLVDGTQTVATLTTSGDATIGDDLTVTDLTTLLGLLVMSSGDLAATGTNQATAAPIVKTVSNVTAADGTKAVLLPAAVAGTFYLVYNSVATNGLPIFPSSTNTINGGSASAAITIEGKTLAVLVATSSTNYAAVFTANT